MNGKELYEAYQDESLGEGVGMDDWQDLDATDQIVWGKLARRLVRELKEGK